MTRQEAKAQGALIYDGPPCQRGHAGRRYVSSWGCVECARERQRDHAEEWVRRKVNAYHAGLLSVKRRKAAA